MIQAIRRQGQEEAEREREREREREGEREGENHGGKSGSECEGNAHEAARRVEGAEPGEVQGRDSVVTSTWTAVACNGGFVQQE